MPKLLSGETMLYPILGDPVRFVESPARLTAAFEQHGHNGVCVPMQVPEAGFDQVMRGLAAIPNVRGLLITMPHKATAFSYCTTASQTATLLGVVSLMRRNPDATWHGDMLDGRSFVAAMKAHGAQTEGARVLQVGAGSAGGAIAIALLDAGVQRLVLHDTESAKSNELARKLNDLYSGRTVAGPPDPTGCNIVVNATPMGMSPHDPLPVPGHLLTSGMFVADVVAGHGVTPFLQSAIDAGCKTSDGSAMVQAGMKLMLDFFKADTVPTP